MRKENEIGNVLKIKQDVREMYAFFVNILNFTLVYCNVEESKFSHQNVHKPVNTCIMYINKPIEK